jgi:hypothetical protein
MKLEYRLPILLGSMLSTFVSGCSDRMAPPPTIPTPAVGQSSEQRASDAGAFMVATEVRIDKAMSHGRSCNIETANGIDFEKQTPALRLAAPVNLAGWLIDEEDGNVPSKVTIRMESSEKRSAWEQPVTIWGARPDVVMANDGNKNYLMSGFTVKLDLPEIQPGSYSIYLAYQRDGGEVVCGVGRMIKLSE